MCAGRPATCTVVFSFVVPLLASFPDHPVLLAYSTKHGEGRKVLDILSHIRYRKEVPTERTHLVHAIFMLNSKLYVFYNITKNECVLSVGTPPHFFIHCI